VFRLNRNKQKNNRNSVTDSLLYFGIFFIKFRVVSTFSVCFGSFLNSLFRLFRFYTETDSFDVSIELKQTEDQLKQFDREHILVLFRKFRVVSVPFEMVLFVSVGFDIGLNTETNRNF
jgi:hypothetical protein